MAHCDYDEMITKWLRNVSVCYVRILSWLRVWVIIRKRFAKTRADSNWVREKKWWIQSWFAETIVVTSRRKWFLM